MRSEPVSDLSSDASRSSGGYRPIHPSATWRLHMAAGRTSPCQMAHSPAAGPLGRWPPATSTARAAPASQVGSVSQPPTFQTGVPSLALLFFPLANAGRTRGGRFRNRRFAHVNGPLPLVRLPLPSDIIPIISAAWVFSALCDSPSASLSPLPSPPIIAAAG